MTATILKLPTGTSEHGTVFVTAWEKWVRGTAQDLADAPDFETLTLLLGELGVCNSVLEILVGVNATDAATER